MSNNLQGPRVIANQNDKEQTINDEVGRIDAALTEMAAVSVTDPYFMTVEQFCSTFGALVTDDDLVGDYELHLPYEVKRGLYWVMNAGSGPLTVALYGDDLNPSVTIPAATDALIVVSPPLIRLLTLYPPPA